MLAELADRRLLETENRGHASFSLRHRLLHQPATLPHHPDRVRQPERHGLTDAATGPGH